MSTWFLPPSTYWPANQVQSTDICPDLFLIFVSDTSGLVKNFVSLFTDDTKLYTYLLDLLNETDEADKYTTQSIQKDKNSVAHWSEIMQMNFNIKKCHSLHMGSNNNHHQ